MAPPPDPLFTEYMTRLKQVYKTPPPHWGPLPQCELIKLAMIKELGKRLGGTHGNPIVNLQEKYRDIEKTMIEKPSVEMDKLFDDGTFDIDRKVILVEGAPGMGKTMLAHHYCQKWAAGELSMFDVVILVPLRELDVQIASSLADLLLIASAKHVTKRTTREMAQHVANHLLTTNAKSLFIFDGWDEFPAVNRKYSFVQAVISNPQFVSSQTTILVTSRPDSSLDLHDLANRVEILGFTEHNIHEYFRKSLSTKLAQDKVESGFIKLKDHLRDYPVIQSCCYVPLNSAILMHVFHSCEQALPKTRYELFHALALCLINRERQTRPYRGGLEGVSSLNDPNVKYQLSHICTLAYEGVKQTKAVFNQEELSAYNLPTHISTLGILLCVEQFTLYGYRTVSYHFLHLSIQELLAAYHISQMEEGKQVEVFVSLLGEPRFSAVLQFYAAFTKLTNQGVRNFITAEFLLGRHHYLLLLLNCLFEAQLQDQSLYHLIISNLNSEIYLAHTTLSPVDCMSVGYFLASILPMSTGELTVDLFGCRITAHSVSLLLGELSKRVDTSAGVLQGMVSLDVSDNNIGDNGIIHIAKALGRNSTLKKLDISSCGITEVGVESLAEALATNSSLNQLLVSGNSIGDNGIVHIVKALERNSTLEELGVSRCGMTEVGVESLAEALAANNSLKQLLVSGSNIGDNGIVHIAKVLERNSTLRVLDISRCGITEVGLESLAETVAINNSLQTLNISTNQITDTGMACIFRALKRSSTLKQFIIRGCGLTEVGVELLAEALPTNHSLERLVLHWSSTHPDQTLRKLAECVKKSALEELWVSLNPRPNEEQLLSVEKAREYLQSLEVGVKEFIQSQEDGRLRQFSLHSLLFEVPKDEVKQAYKSVIASALLVQSARREKGLPPIDVQIIL